MKERLLSVLLIFNSTLDFQGPAPPIAEALRGMCSLQIFYNFPCTIQITTSAGRLSVPTVFNCSPISLLPSRPALRGRCLLWGRQPSRMSIPNEALQKVSTV